MKFEIPFVENIYKNQVNLNFDLVWKKTIKKNKKTLLTSIILFLLGFLIIYGNDNLGYILIAFSIYGFIEFYKIHSSYKKSKLNYFTITENESIKQIELNEKSIWEFNDEYFRYKDYKYDAKINWIAFKGYRIIEDNLFLDLNVGNFSSYILSQKEVGNNHFDNIIQLVDQKTKRITD
ncbi:hypothetical protein [Flavobacterium undicola]|uniref:hypothetical protein n=1 Tax=Flavobacterium undicola TaxID=1932779 RepID=UPI00137876AB|nr:hypothetical protein [Flavobacterium undicola]MBA0885025.1 hypothetical protein [Flavobacterium undicola]